MGALMDLLDQYVFGPLNLLDRLEGLLSAGRHRDAGHEIAIPRVDKGGKFSLNEVRDLLRRYGVATYGRRFDAHHMYIRVKKRQARWAEYVLLRAGVELGNPLYDPRNAGYPARHPPGTMPRAWADRSRAHPRAGHSGRPGPSKGTSPGDEDLVDRLFRLFID